MTFPVFAIGYATANALAMILELLHAPLLTIEKSPPSRFCFPAVEANQIGHELPSLCVWCLRINNERSFEFFLRPFSFFARDLCIVF